MKAISGKCIGWNDSDPDNPDYTVITFANGRTFNVLNVLKVIELPPRILPFDLERINLDNIPPPFLPLGKGCVQKNLKNSNIGFWEY